MIFVLQAGNNRHEDICESIELFGKTVLPAVADGRDLAEAAKREHLAGAVERATAPRVFPEPYPIAEVPEMEAHQAWAKTR